jgi:solute carrier family 25 carnitine/acylcarnitine transporter 20/29
MGFYKGMLMPLLGVGVQVSVQFGIVETMKKMLKKNYGNPDGTLDPNYTFLSGAVAGVFSGIIVVILYSFRLP